MKRLLFCITLFVMPLSTFAQMTTEDNVTSPIIAATNAQLKNAALDSAMSLGWLDAPLSASGDGYYLISHASQINWGESCPPDPLRQVKTYGGFLDPYANEQWVKRTCKRLNGYCINTAETFTYTFTSFASGLTDVVNLWFTSIYNPGGAERLAFIHEENVNITGINCAQQEWTLGTNRIGLAYSSDSGNTWKYLGRIAAPYREQVQLPNGSIVQLNVEGTPYYIYNGDFYIWYKDQNRSAVSIAVSKANVASVLAAARAGNLGSNLWQKKSIYGWNSDIAAEPAFPDTAGEYGIMHSQAARAADGNYYILTTRQAAVGASGWEYSYVRLFTVNPVTLAWTKKMDIVNEHMSTFNPDNRGKGYQYASLVDPLGRANGEVGSAFYVYSAKFQDSDPPFKQALYQWQVNTTPPADFYKESRGFIGVQGYNQWSYESVLSRQPMIWNAEGYWQRPDWQQPTDIYNRIYKGAASTGQYDGFLMIWTAPKTGTVTVRQTVRSAQPNPSCGDGVNFAFQKNDALQFYGHIDWDDTLGKSSVLSIPVVGGDQLYFYGTKGGTNYCDTLFWDPSISYN